jgi:hypothetical protein
LHGFVCLLILLRITEFAPVLNVPAFSVFLFIIVTYGALQWRINQIRQAADDRTIALQELRRLKKDELEGQTTTTDVEAATTRYRLAVEKVEDLRNVIPGVARIQPPPSPRMDDNVAAAKQFLNMDLEAFQSPPKNTPPLAGWKLAILGLVALTQLGLLALLMEDPMAPSRDLF